MYNILLRIVFLFCFGVSIFVLSVDFLDIKISVDEDYGLFLWLLFTYPIMWLTLFLFQYEEDNSTDSFNRVINTQNISNSISFISGLHIFSLILWSIEHKLHELSVHYFFYFLMVCCLGFILFNFTVSVIHMFSGSFAPIFELFKREKQWR